MVEKSEEENKEVSEQKIDDKLSEMCKSEDQKTRFFAKIIFNLRFDLRQLAEALKHLANAMKIQLEWDEDYLAYPKTDLNKTIGRIKDDIYS